MRYGWGSIFSEKRFVREAAIHELRASIFCGFFDDLPDCADGCPTGPDGGELCEEPVTLCGNGRVLRIGPDEAPSPVTFWPCCPRKYQVLWDSKEDECNPFLLTDGALDPNNVMAFEYERGTHKRRLAAGAENLFRVWLHDRSLPEKLFEARHVEEMKKKGGK